MNESVVRLRQALRALGEVDDGPTAIARFLRIDNPQTVKNWETRGMSNEGMVAASRKGINPAWLADGVQPMLITAERPPIIINENDADYVTIQAGTIRASAGVTGFAVDVENKPDKPIIFRRDWMQRRGYTAGTLYAMKVSGRSMEPTLFDGDTVVVDTAHPEPLDGEVFLVNAGGEVVVKRLARRSGDWWMHSDNSNQSLFPPVRCDADCFIIGRIIHRQSETI